MASTNQSPQYQKAESEYLQAQTNEDKLYWLQEMIKECPKHKSAEKMLAQLKTRLRKLKEHLQKSKKSSGGKSGIKKADMQAVIIGLTNSGKSSLLRCLTNANPEISEREFATKEIEVGVMEYQGVQIQILENPGLKSENFDRGIISTADLILMAVTNIKEIEEIKNMLPKTNAKEIIVFNKSDLLEESEKRKLSETLKTKKYNFTIVSAKTLEGINELKEKIFSSFEIVRIYLKEPGKSPSDRPLIMKPGSKIAEVAEKIKKGLSNRIKQARITGPSSKFPNQIVGLNHLVKDKDIVEFRTR